MKKISTILLIIMFGASAYAGDDHEHDTHEIHKKMHINRGHTQIAIGGLGYAQCSNFGICDLLYLEGRANKQAQRWGFFLPKLTVRMDEFSNRVLIDVNKKCYYQDSWRESIWEKTINKIKNAKEIQVFGRKHRRILQGHLYLDNQPLIEILYEINIKNHSTSC